MGYVYGCTNLSVVDAMEVPDCVKLCWNPVSPAKYGFFNADKQFRKILTSLSFNYVNQPDDNFEEFFSYPMCVLDKPDVTQGVVVNKMLGFHLFICRQPDIRDRLNQEGWNILLRFIFRFRGSQKQH